MEIKFSPISEEHVEFMLKEISWEDRREALAMGFSLEWVLRSSLKNSEQSMAILVDGELVCLLGVVFEDTLSAVATPWMVATPKMQLFRRPVLVYSKKVLSMWLEQYGYLENYVDARNHRTITWLTHLGASFEYLPYFGPYARPFYRFSFGEKN